MKVVIVLGFLSTSILCPLDKLSKSWVLCHICSLYMNILRSPIDGDRSGWTNPCRAPQTSIRGQIRQCIENIKEGTFYRRMSNWRIHACKEGKLLMKRNYSCFICLPLSRLKTWIVTFLWSLQVPGNLMVSARSESHSFDSSQMNMSHVVNHLSFGKRILPEAFSDLKRLAPYLGGSHNRLDDRSFINQHDLGPNVTVSFCIFQEKCTIEIDIFVLCSML